MYSDPRWLEEVFRRRNAKACVLVFSSDVTSDELRRICSDLDIQSAASKTKVNIIYPIRREEDDDDILSLWSSYNPEGVEPRFVFTKADGTQTGIMLDGAPSVAELMRCLQRVIEH